MRLLELLFVVLSTTMTNAPAFVGTDATVVDCCQCDERYTGDTRITWYTSALTCEKHPSPSLSCRRIHVAGRTCESTRWVRGPEGLACQTVDLKAVQADGSLLPVKLSGMSPCQANKTLALMHASHASLAEANARAANQSTVADIDSGAGGSFCSCDHDRRDPSHCVLFRTERGHAAVVDRRPLPEGSLHCDRAACSQLFLTDHAAQCPVYYQGPPAVTASAEH